MQIFVSLFDSHKKITNSLNSLFMKLFLSFICFFYFFSSIFAQEKVEKNASYKLNGPINVYKKDPDNNCTSDKFKICTNSKIKVTNKDSNGKVTIRLKRKVSQYTKDGTIICKTEANTSDLYCIDEANLVPNIKVPEILPTFGILTVPFKFQTKDFQIFTSGNIGGFFGIQKRINWNPFGEASYLFLVGTAGYSRIPLNNVNTSVSPDNVDDVGAVTYGFSTGLAIGKFQVMLVKGWDNYNVNESKQNRSWISFGMGFGFLTPKSE